MLTFEKLQRSRIHQSDPAPQDTLDELETIISIEHFCGSCSHPVVQLRTFRHGLVSLPNDTFFLMEVETDTKVLIKGEFLDPDAVFENVTKRVWMTKSEIVDTGLWDVNEFERQAQFPAARTRYPCRAGPRRTVERRRVTEHDTAMPSEACQTAKASRDQLLAWPRQARRWKGRGDSLSAKQKRTEKDAPVAHTDPVLKSRTPYSFSGGMLVTVNRKLTVSVRLVRGVDHAARHPWS